VYNVSRDTIIRDSQVASAITAIGMTSPEAKSDILSGKTRLSRKYLMELAAGPEDDVAEVAARLEDGTFGSWKASAHAPKGEMASVGSDTEDTPQWERVFGRITDDFNKELWKISKNDDTVAVRKALRLYIGMLEDLYGNI